MSDTPFESSFKSALGYVALLHEQELEKRDEHINSLQIENQQLEAENSDLKQSITDCKRVATQERGKFESMNKDKEVKILGLQVEIGKLNQELTIKRKEIAQLMSERDKANYIIKKLINKQQNL